MSFQPIDFDLKSVPGSIFFSENSREGFFAIFFLISQVSIVLKNSFGTKSVISFFSRLGLNDSVDAAVVADDPGRNEGDLFAT